MVEFIKLLCFFTVKRIIKLNQVLGPRKLASIHLEVHNGKVLKLKILNTTGMYV